MLEPEFTLEKSDRVRVLHSAVNSCAYRGWHLFCVHIRTNHIHVISQADVPVNQMLIYLKARATKELKAHHPDRQRFWTKHGSTRYIWDRNSLDATLDYVTNQQGPPMELWEHSNRFAHGSE